MINRDLDQVKTEGKSIDPAEILKKLLCVAQFLELLEDNDGHRTQS
jgi:hypothetical protein